MSAVVSDAPARRFAWFSSWGDLALVMAVVLIASLFGILTRPVGFLAAFWPANALLLGIMVRRPRLANASNWIGAFVAYMAADLATGGKFQITLWLTAANMIGAMTGYSLFRFVTAEDRRLLRPQSVLYLVLICAGAAFAAAVSGGGAAKVIFARDFRTGVEFWFVTEFVNNIIILPLVLTMPLVLPKPRQWGRRSRSLLGRQALRQAYPVCALFASCIVVMLVGGPGAIAFAVPALVWCGLSYDIFPASVLTALFCAGMLIAASTGLITVPMSQDIIGSTSSLRLGVALMAIAPLTVASINRSRSELLSRLSYVADHDALTGILSRRAFMMRAGDAVAEAERKGIFVAFFMLDIDHFKRINDTHGHVTGDLVLIELAKRVAVVLRDTDIFGRLGGEEFAVALPGVDIDQAMAVAERIRVAVSQSPVTVAGQVTVSLSTSIGVSILDPNSTTRLDDLMAQSDHALYKAKSAGRNRVLQAA